MMCSCGSAAGAFSIRKARQKSGWENASCNVPYLGAPGDGNTSHDWTAEAFEWVVKNGYLRDSSADKPDYRLNDSVTREELVVLL